MIINELEIKGSWIAESTIWKDSRGEFREWFKLNDIEKLIGKSFSVKQANVSLSNKGVLRGIHYSLARVGQSKWVTCVAGNIVDVIVDIRPNSPTFKKFELINLSADVGRAVLIGAGLGHAFLSLENNSVVSYLLDSPYSQIEEFEINPLDSEIAINWPCELIDNSDFIISSKDANAPSLAEQLALGRLPLI